MSNIITATFNGQRTTYTEPLYQWDYGQVLMFGDLNLPETYQVDFVNSVTAYSSMGNAEGVAIPDDCLKVSGMIKAYVFLHTGEDDGETEYVAFINVIARPQAGGSPPSGGGNLVKLNLSLDMSTMEVSVTGITPTEIIDGIKAGIMYYTTTVIDEPQGYYSANPIVAVIEDDGSYMMGVTVTTGAPAELYWDGEKWSSSQPN